MSDISALYRDLKPDLEQVSGPLLEFAQQQVRKRGAFLPFGATLNRSGEVALQAGSSGEEVESAGDVLPILHAGLRATAARGDVAAVAVCEWVKITPEGSGQTDAVKVLVEHERGLTIAFHVPCRRRMLGGWQFGDVLAKAVEPEVRPWHRGDAA